MKTIGIIGCGNMGEAIFSRIRLHFSVFVAEKESSRRRYLKKKYKICCRDLNFVVSQSDALILAVKPQGFDVILADVKKTIDDSKVVISIAAGISTSYIEKRLGKKIRVVRTMPNLLALIGQSVTAVCGGRVARKNDVSAACKIFNHIGRTVVVQEKWMDSITAVSGSGPAYVFLFMECLMKAAKSVGLDEKLACQLVQDTLKGSIQLVEQQKADPAQLRARVTSKGGTTQAALEVFQKNNFEKIIEQAIRAAQKRAQTLARR